MARQPNRTPQEKLEDLFFDMSVPEQEKALATFQTLHRMKRRLLDKPAPEPATEPGLRAEITASSVQMFIGDEPVSEVRALDEVKTETGTPS